jgi:hypothetical protein
LIQVAATLAQRGHRYNIPSSRRRPGLSTFAIVLDRRSGRFGCKTRRSVFVNVQMRPSMAAIFNNSPF